MFPFIYKMDITIKEEIDLTDEQYGQASDSVPTKDKKIEKEVASHQHEKTIEAVTNKPEDSLRKLNLHLHSELEKKKKELHKLRQQVYHDENVVRKVLNISEENEDNKHVSDNDKSIEASSKSVESKSSSIENVVAVQEGEESELRIENSYSMNDPMELFESMERFKDRAFHPPMFQPGSISFIREQIVWKGMEKHSITSPRSTIRMTKFFYKLALNDYISVNEVCALQDLCDGARFNYDIQKSINRKHKQKRAEEFESKQTSKMTVSDSAQQFSSQGRNFKFHEYSPRERKANNVSFLPKVQATSTDVGSSTPVSESFCHMCPYTAPLKACRETIMKLCPTHQVSSEVVNIAKQVRCQAKQDLLNKPKETDYSMENALAKEAELIRKAFTLRKENTGDTKDKLENDITEIGNNSKVPEQTIILQSQPNLNDFESSSTSKEENNVFQTAKDTITNTKLPEADTAARAKHGHDRQFQGVQFTCPFQIPVSVKTSRGIEKEQLHKTNDDECVQKLDDVVNQEGIELPVGQVGENLVETPFSAGNHPPKPAFNEHQDMAIEGDKEIKIENEDIPEVAIKVEYVGDESEYDQMSLLRAAGDQSNFKISTPAKSLGDNNVNTENNNSNASNAKIQEIAGTSSTDHYNRIQSKSDKRIQIIDDNVDEKNVRLYKTYFADYELLVEESTKKPCMFTIDDYAISLGNKLQEAYIDMFKNLIQPLTIQRMRNDLGEYESSKQLKICYICSRKWNGIFNLWFHIVACHVDWMRVFLMPKNFLFRVNEPFFCSHCLCNGPTFPTINAVQTHEEKEHPKTLNCYFCGARRCSEVENIVHVALEHGTLNDKSKYSKLYCPYCLKRNKRIENLYKIRDLTAHIALAHKELDFYFLDQKCFSCKATFTNKEALILHVGTDPASSCPFRIAPMNSLIKEQKTYPKIGKIKNAQDKEFQYTPLFFMALLNLEELEMEEATKVIDKLLTNFLLEYPLFSQNDVFTNAESLVMNLIKVYSQSTRFKALLKASGMKPLPWDKSLGNLEKQFIETHRKGKQAIEGTSPSTTKPSNSPSTSSGKPSKSKVKPIAAGPTVKTIAAFQLMPQQEADTAMNDNEDSSVNTLPAYNLIPNPDPKLLTYGPETLKAEQNHSHKVHIGKAVDFKTESNDTTLNPSVQTGLQTESNPLSALNQLTSQVGPQTIIINNQKGGSNTIILGNTTNQTLPNPTDSNVQLVNQSQNVFTLQPQLNNGSFQMATPLFTQQFQPQLQPLQQGFMMANTGVIGSPGPLIQIRPVVYMNQNPVMQPVPMNQSNVIQHNSFNQSQLFQQLPTNQSTVQTTIANQSTQPIELSKHTLAAYDDKFPMIQSTNKNPSSIQPKNINKPSDDNNLARFYSVASVSSLIQSDGLFKKKSIRKKRGKYRKKLNSKTNSKTPKKVPKLEPTDTPKKVPNLKLEDTPKKVPYLKPKDTPKKVPYIKPKDFSYTKKYVEIQMPYMRRNARINEKPEWKKRIEQLQRMKLYNALPKRLKKTRKKKGMERSTEEEPKAPLIEIPKVVPKPVFPCIAPKTAKPSTVTLAKLELKGSELKIVSDKKLISKYPFIQPSIMQPSMQPATIESGVVRPASEKTNNTIIVTQSSDEKTKDAESNKKPNKKKKRKQISQSEFADDSEKSEEWEKMRKKARLDRMHKVEQTLRLTPRKLRERKISSKKKYFLDETDEECENDNEEGKIHHISRKKNYYSDNEWKPKRYNEHSEEESDVEMDGFEEIDGETDDIETDEIEYDIKTSASRKDGLGHVEAVMKTDSEIKSSGIDKIGPNLEKSINMKTTEIVCVQGKKETLPGKIENTRKPFETILCVSDKTNQDLNIVQIKNRNMEMKLSIVSYAEAVKHAQFTKCSVRLVRNRVAEALAVSMQKSCELKENSHLDDNQVTEEQKLPSLQIQIQPMESDVESGDEIFRLMPTLEMSSLNEQILPENVPIEMDEVDEMKRIGISDDSEISCEEKKKCTTKRKIGRPRKRKFPIFKKHVDFSPKPNPEKLNDYFVKIDKKSTLNTDTKEKVKTFLFSKSSTCTAVPIMQFKTIAPRKEIVENPKEALNNIGSVCKDDLEMTELKKLNQDSADLCDIKIVGTFSLAVEKVGEPNKNEAENSNHTVSKDKCTSKITTPGNVDNETLHESKETDQTSLKRQDKIHEIFGKYESSAHSAEQTGDIQQDKQTINTDHSSPKAVQGDLCDRLTTEKDVQIGRKRGRPRKFSSDLEEANKQVILAPTGVVVHVLGNVDKQLPLDTAKAQQNNASEEDKEKRRNVKEMNKEKEIQHNLDVEASASTVHMEENNDKGSHNKDVHESKQLNIESEEIETNSEHVKENGNKRKTCQTEMKQSKRKRSKMKHSDFAVVNELRKLHQADAKDLNEIRKIYLEDSESNSPETRTRNLRKRTNVANYTEEFSDMDTGTDSDDYTEDKSSDGECFIIEHEVEKPIVIDSDDESNQDVNTESNIKTPSELEAITNIEQSQVIPQQEIPMMNYPTTVSIQSSSNQMGNTYQAQPFFLKNPEIQDSIGVLEKIRNSLPDTAVSNQNTIKVHSQHVHSLLRFFDYSNQDLSTKKKLPSKEEQVQERLKVLKDLMKPRDSTNTDTAAKTFDKYNYNEETCTFNKHNEETCTFTSATSSLPVELKEPKLEPMEQPDTPTSSTALPTTNLLQNQLTSTFSAPSLQPSPTMSVQQQTATSFSQQVFIPQQSSVLSTPQLSMMPIQQMTNSIQQPAFLSFQQPGFSLQQFPLTFTQQQTHLPLQQQIPVLPFQNVPQYSTGLTQQTELSSPPIKLNEKQNENQLTAKDEASKDISDNEMTESQDDDIIKSEKGVRKRRKRQQKKQNEPIARRSLRPKGPVKVSEQPDKPGKQAHSNTINALSRTVASRHDSALVKLEKNGEENCLANDEASSVKEEKQVTQDNLAEQNNPLMAKIKQEVPEPTSEADTTFSSSCKTTKSSSGNELKQQLPVSSVGTLVPQPTQNTALQLMQGQQNIMYVQQGNNLVGINMQGQNMFQQNQPIRFPVLLQPQSFMSPQILQTAGNNPQQQFQQINQPQIIQPQQQINQQFQINSPQTNPPQQPINQQFQQTFQPQQQSNQQFQQMNQQPAFQLQPSQFVQMMQQPQVMAPAAAAGQSQMFVPIKPKAQPVSNQTSIGPGLGQTNIIPSIFGNQTLNIPVNTNQTLFGPVATPASGITVLNSSGQAVSQQGVVGQGNIGSGIVNPNQGTTMVGQVGNGGRGNKDDSGMVVVLIDGKQCLVPRSMIKEAKQAIGIGLDTAEQGKGKTTH